MLTAVEEIPDLDRLQLEHLEAPTSKVVPTMLPGLLALFLQLLLLLSLYISVIAYPVVVFRSQSIAEMGTLVHWTLTSCTRWRKFRLAEGTQSLDKGGHVPGSDKASKSRQFIVLVRI